MLNYEVCRNWQFDDIVIDYAERDTMLYALGLGIGGDPTDAGQLRFVYEAGLQAIPTMAAAMGTPGIWWRDPRTGADPVRLVHGEHRLRMHKPLPVAAGILCRNRVASITDKGPGRGAVAVVVRDTFDRADGSLICEGTMVTVLRGDGGFSAADGRSDPAPEPLPPVPERAADAEFTVATLPQQALLYRLSGDYNPLHADPAVAAAAGFPRPILQGLCTFGMAAWAAIRCMMGNDATRFTDIAVRFTAPVLPGDRVRYELWREGAGTIRLRASVDERNVVVLNNGVIGWA